MNSVKHCQKKVGYESDHVLGEITNKSINTIKDIFYSFGYSLVK